EALRAYTRLRSQLRDELGIDPSPEVTQLEAAILAHAPELGAPPAARQPEPTSDFRRLLRTRDPTTPLRRDVSEGERSTGVRRHDGVHGRRVAFARHGTDEVVDVVEADDAPRHLGERVP